MATTDYFHFSSAFSPCCAPAVSSSWNRKNGKPMQKLNAWTLSAVFDVGGRLSISDVLMQSLRENAKTLKLRPADFEACLVEIGFLDPTEHLGSTGTGGA